MKSNRAYWLCQILGWSSYSLLTAWGAAQSVGWTSEIVVGFGLYVVYSIALSHALRAYIKRRGWLTPEPRYFRLLLAAWITGLIQAVLVIAINLLLVHRQSGFLRPSVAVGASIGISAVTVGWMITYIAVTATRRTREKQLALRDAELRALELQINPHFLFNSLNSIRGLVIENPPLAQDLITRLANILRYNLHRDAGHTVPLSSELEATADYLALESARYEDRLRVHYDIADPARSLAVPPMLVQTLVENAIKHGIATLPDGGDLRLSAALENGFLLLRVENPGKVGQALPTANSREAAGLGLQNLRDRLRLLYGPGGKLDLYSRDGRVTATVRIPLES
jgi:LytS/YehU family sensor histidine kinase